MKPLEVLQKVDKIGEYIHTLGVGREAWAELYRTRLYPLGTTAREALGSTGKHWEALV